MPYSFTRFLLSFLCGWSILTAPSMAAERMAVKYKFNLPPSANLAYSIKAQQSGLSINGEALVEWKTARNAFSVITETRAMLVGKILDAKSEGIIDQYGLAPTAFTETRFRKMPTTATFNHQTKTLSFTESAQTYPIKGGEQDRTSVIWQLIAVARGTPAKFKTGSAWNFFVAGQRDAEPWSFKVIKQEKISAPQGEVSAWHIVKAPPPNAKGQKLDIWLAPSLEWYPVKLRFTDADGEFIEQTLEKISRN